MEAVKPILVNLFGGPGSGKSTAAAGLFYLMKSIGLKVELITEYAKELSYSYSLDGSVKQQLGILEVQRNRQNRLGLGVDFVITDSPLQANRFYTLEQDENYLQKYTNAVQESFNNFIHINFLIERVQPYQQYGRKETEEEALAIDRLIRRSLIIEDVEASPVFGDNMAPQTLLNHIIDKSYVP